MSEKLTPMMEQYYRIKQKYKDALLFFRVGDFYELFDDDARIASKELGIVLTSRDKKHAMCGVPHHAAYSYIKKLIEKGYKVAICEQVEEPTGKKLVRREVVRVITPGTVVEEELLTTESNYLMALFKRDKVALAFLDVSTGEFFVTSVKNVDEAICEVLKYSPVECLIPESFEEIEELEKLVKNVRRIEDEQFNLKRSLEVLKDVANFQTLELSEEEILACGAVLNYAKNSLLFSKPTLKLQKLERSEYMILDSTTIRNLEIFRNLVDGSKRGTLLDVIDKTVTAMGSRLLKKWLQRPLLDITEIERRLDAVEELKEKSFVRRVLRETLEEVYDLERIITRLELGKANPKDLVALKNSLKAVGKLKKFDFQSKKLRDLVYGMNPMEELCSLIEKAIVEDPPANVKDGGVIKEGFDEELDELRKEKREHEEFIKRLEERERKRTGIENLKVGYNNVFGYYIEIPKSKAKNLPRYYIRKQTLVNAERFTIPELKDREEKILAYEERIRTLEQEIFERIRGEVVRHAEKVKDSAERIAELDVLCSLAEVATLYNYTRPKVNEGFDIIIRDGRHPAVEITTKFVPNDVNLTENSRILIITGPNMAGKSTYLRQVALITILAQIGSFVPASYAVIGIVDKIFTRIGLVDDITRGRSTFMVEMLEIGRILNNATKRSLILLDEVGKSTGTKEGLSLAWAIVEYLHELGAKVLFATHYHELSKLENELSGVKNYHFRLKEENGRVEFDRKIRRGFSKESYGIKIAEMANLPRRVVERAYEILNSKNVNGEVPEIVEEISKIDVMNLTPVQALVELERIVRKCRELKS
ncbi:DNA mismatch repair protein MutS [Ferroglobus sp.]|uniref:DNA mismatch repair protein MutS n=1 Tax=Ferroglobus sp. TaxID=2614230 RepID=UPI0025C58FF9|nr:DNA mismatch repair protein MutS [Ferroglobus sp.]